MAITQCALFYWTSSGILTSKMLLDDDSQYAFLTAPPGQTLFLTPTVATSMGQGCPTDDECRVLIGTHRGVVPVSADADRAAQIDASGNVVAILKADPANVTPAELGLPTGHTLQIAPAAVMEGDTFLGGAFHRRFVIAANATGTVAQVVLAQINATGIVLAIAVPTGLFAAPSATAQVGQAVSLPRSVAAAIGSLPPQSASPTATEAVNTNNPKA